MKKPQEITIGIDIATMATIEAVSMVSQKQEELLAKQPPKREDYSTEEEFNQAVENFMLDAIDYVSVNKKAIFVYTLDRYNSFLRKLHTCEDLKKKLEKEHMEGIAEHVKGGARSIFATVLATLLIPSGFPIIAALGGTTYICHRVSLFRHIQDLNKEEMMMTGMKDMQDRFFTVMDSLRTDYHESNKKYEELKERAKKRENIMPTLIDMMDVEKTLIPNLHLQNLSQMEMIPVEMKDNNEHGVQYTLKQKNSNE